MNASLSLETQVETTQPRTKNQGKVLLQLDPEISRKEELHQLENKKEKKKRAYFPNPQQVGGY